MFVCLFVFFLLVSFVFRKQNKSFWGSSVFGRESFEIGERVVLFGGISVDDNDVFYAFFSNGAFCAGKLGFHFFLATEL